MQKLFLIFLCTTVALVGQHYEGPSVEAHNDYPCFSASYSPDGQELATASGKYAIVLMDAALYNPKNVLGASANIEGNETVVSAVYSSCGKILASVTSEGSMKLWDRETGTAFCVKRDEIGFSTVAFANEIVATANSSTRYVLLWDARTRDPVGSLPFVGHVNSIALRPDHDQLVVAADCCLGIWDAKMGHCLSRTDVQGYHAATVSSDGSELLAISSSGKVESCKLSPSEQLKEILCERKFSLQEIAYSHNRKLIATAHGNIVALWDAKSQKLLSEWIGAKARISALTFSSDSEHLVVGSPGQEGRCWDAAKHPGSTCIWQIPLGEEHE